MAESPILWTPGRARDKVEVTTHERRVRPDAPKREGGTYFDDELETEFSHQRALQVQYNEMVEHLRQRPDHTVYVSSVEDRDNMRAVFNHMYRSGVIKHFPTIRIDYGIPEGNIRIRE